jgi:hypothetical protein
LLAGSRVESTGTPSFFLMDIQVGYVIGVWRGVAWHEWRVALLIGLSHALELTGGDIRIQAECGRGGQGAQCCRDVGRRMLRLIHRSTISNMLWADEWSAHASQLWITLKRRCG